MKLTTLQSSENYLSKVYLQFYSFAELAFRAQFLVLGKTPQLEQTPKIATKNVSKQQPWPSPKIKYLRPERDRCIFSLSHTRPLFLIYLFNWHKHFQIFRFGSSYSSTIPASLTSIDLRLYLPRIFKSQVGLSKLKHDSKLTCFFEKKSFSRNLT